MEHVTYLPAVLVLAALGGITAVLLIIARKLLADYGPCAVTVNDRDPFVTEGGCSVLEALYGQGIFIPSACGGQGTCGLCKIEVPSGGGPLLPTEMPYLCREEITAGTRLACQVKIREDIRIRVRPDYLEIREFRAVVTSATMVTHDTREITLALVEPGEIEFSPGQYIQVRVPSAFEPTYRAYSLSSPPSSRGEIELLVRLVPGGLASTYLHGVRTGEEIVFTGPYGDFVLDEDPDVELVCVGGGCGLAPMRSIIRHLREVTPGRACRLFFGVRAEEDLMYLDELTALRGDMPRLEVHCALSEPGRGAGWKGETGFIHESVAAHLEPGDNRQAFLCGPPAMIAATITVLEEKGIPREGVYFDEF